MTERPCYNCGREHEWLVLTRNGILKRWFCLACLAYKAVKP